MRPGDLIRAKPGLKAVKAVYLICCLVALSTGRAEIAEDSNDSDESSTDLIQSRSEKLFVGDLNGRVHAIDAQDGTVLWTVDTGGALISAYQNESLFAGSLVVPTLSGSILVYSAAESMLQRLPISAVELVDRSPFLADDGIVYIGSKRSDFFYVDSGTGEVERAFITGGRAAPMFGQGERAGAQRAGGKVLVGRQEFCVTAIDPTTGAQSWNATVSFYSDVRSLQPNGAPAPLIPREPKVRLVTTRGGAVHAVDRESGDRLWTAHLQAPAVRAFSMVGDGAQAEIEIHASASSNDNHYVDDESSVLGEDQFQLVAYTADRQLYARGGVLGVQVQPAGPAAHEEEERVPQPQPGGLVRYDEGAQGTCSANSMEFPMCLIGIHALQLPSQPAILAHPTTNPAIAPSPLQPSLPPSAPAAPSVLPPGGSFLAPVSVAISFSPPDAAVRFTVDGSEPSCSSSLMLPAVDGVAALVLENSSKLKLVKCVQGLGSSDVLALDFSLQAHPPSFLPPSGTFGGEARVKVVSRTPGVRVVYSLDGQTPSCSTTPSTSSSVLANSSEAINVSATSFLLALACREGISDSAVVASGQYNIQPRSQIQLLLEFSPVATAMLNALTTWAEGGGESELDWEAAGADNLASFLLSIGAILPVWLCFRRPRPRRAKTEGGGGGGGGGTSPQLAAGGSGEGGGRVEGESVLRSVKGAGKRGKGKQQQARGEGGASKLRSVRKEEEEEEEENGGGGKEEKEEEEEEEEQQEEERERSKDKMHARRKSSEALQRLTRRRIDVDTGAVLGHGSHGTVVYSGRQHGRAVAVKRILVEFIEIAEVEMRNLISSDAHPNIVRYYDMERDGDFVYLALELCSCTLADKIPEVERSKRAPRKAMEDAPGVRLPGALLELMQGVAFLHGLGIVHRDLKPGNILVAADGRLKISDMGLSKKLDQGQSSFDTQAGTVGWRSPEQMRGERLSKKVDVFSLGCVFYHVVSNGHHPFGVSIEREKNILEGRPDLRKISQDKEASDLILKLIRADPKRRPTGEEACLHPFYWDNNWRLQFLLDVSDRLDCEAQSSGLVLDLESRAGKVFGERWDGALSSVLLSDLEGRRKYNFFQLRDLLRALRNKRHHFHEASDIVQILLGHIPDGFFSYWASRFPDLLMEIYTLVRDSSIRDEVLFRRYFQEP